MTGKGDVVLVGKHCISTPVILAGYPLGARIQGIRVKTSV